MSMDRIALATPTLHPGPLPGEREEASTRRDSLRGAPGPVGDLGGVHAVLGDEGPVPGDLGLVLAKDLFRARGDRRIASGDLSGGLDDDVVPAGLVADVHVEGGRGRALLSETVDVETVVARAFPAELFDRGRIAVEVEDDRTAGREDPLEAVLLQAMRVLLGDPQRHQVGHVDD